MPALAATMATDHHIRFQALLEAHRGIIFKIAYSYAWNQDDREDLAQDIAAQLWRAWPDYDPSRTFSTWMYRIALNVAISWLRSHQHRDQHTEPFDEAHADVVGQPGVSHETDERMRALERCIAGLAALDRALVLLYLEERSYREMADILGISETNVATKISRLKQRIRNDIS